jgi:hypothetical protein
MPFPISSPSIAGLWVRGARALGPVTAVDPVGGTTRDDDAQVLDFGPAALVTLSERARSLASEKSGAMTRPQVPTLGADDEDARRTSDDDAADAKGRGRTEGSANGEPAEKTAWSVAPAALEPRDAARAGGVFQEEDGERANQREANGKANASDSEGQTPSGTTREPNELTREQQVQVQQLKNRDRQVRAHEHAHEAAGGSYSGAASYTYKLGPDGKRYAVAGEVPIEVSGVAGDPEATIRKMQTVQRAARAPAEPSGPDLQIAAQAAAIAQRARAELAKERYGAAQASMTSAAVETIIPVQSFSVVG